MNSTGTAGSRVEHMLHMQERLRSLADGVTAMQNEMHSVQQDLSYLVESELIQEDEEAKEAAAAVQTAKEAADRKTERKLRKINAELEAEEESLVDIDLKNPPRTVAEIEAELEILLAQKSVAKNAVKARDYGAELGHPVRDTPTEQELKDVLTKQREDENFHIYCAAKERIDRLKGELAKALLLLKQEAEKQLKAKAKKESNAVPVSINNAAGAGASQGQNDEEETLQAQKKKIYKARLGEETATTTATTTATATAAATSIATKRSELMEEATRGYVRSRPASDTRAAETLGRTSRLGLVAAANDNKNVGGKSGGITGGGSGFSLPISDRIPDPSQADPDMVALSTASSALPTPRTIQTEEDAEEEDGEEDPVLPRWATGKAEEPLTPRRGHSSDKEGTTQGTQEAPHAPRAPLACRDTPPAVRWARGKAQSDSNTPERATSAKNKSKDKDADTDTDTGTGTGTDNAKAEGEEETADRTHAASPSSACTSPRDNTDIREIRARKFAAMQERQGGTSSSSPKTGMGSPA